MKLHIRILQPRIVLCQISSNFPYKLSTADKCKRHTDLHSSSDTTSYTIPHLKTKFGERAFSFVGPVTWNSLPAELRSISDSTVFKNKLKTYLFNMK